MHVMTVQKRIGVYVVVFVKALRELTEKHGAVLIYDEVMTGFRVALGARRRVRTIPIARRSVACGRKRGRSSSKQSACFGFVHGSCFPSRLRSSLNLGLG